MKKLKTSVSFLLLIVLCLLTKNILIFINYICALALHELAHLFVASKFGYSLKVFNLDIFGVSIELNEKIDNQDSFYINIAGPMLNLLMCLICLALYWLIPASYSFLNIFCMCNLVLAIFNLLPVYPLDGGKIFRSLIVDDKKYRIINFIIRLVLFSISLVFFVISIFTKTNLFFLLISVFFIFPNKKEPTLSILKTPKNNKFEKIVLLKISGEENLFSLLKKIKPNHYTIFYFNKTKPLYIDEDKLIDLSTKYPLITRLKELL